MEQTGNIVNRVFPPDFQLSRSARWRLEGLLIPRHQLIGFEILQAPGKRKPTGDCCTRALSMCFAQSVKLRLCQCALQQMRFLVEAIRPFGASAKRAQ